MWTWTIWYWYVLATVTVSQQLDVMMDFAPFARRCKVKYCNNSIPTLSLKLHERNSLMHIFGERGSVGKSCKCIWKCFREGELGEERTEGEGFELKRVLLQSIPIVCKCCHAPPNSPSFFAIIYLITFIYSSLFVYLFLQCIPIMCKWCHASPLSFLFRNYSPSFHQHS